MSALVEYGADADWGDVHPRKAWFDVRPLAEGVFLIAEPGHVNNFLVVGEDRAVLLDTGLGVADIRSVAEGLAGKPLSVVNTHNHFDHTGGNRQFDDIAIHRTGAELLAAPPPEGLAEGYMEYTRKLIESWEGYKQLDDTYFHLVTGETLIRPLPEGFDPAGYEIRPSTATTLLDDGDRIDLGGRVLEVMHTPGHSPDSICLLDERNGLLFGGDTINTGPIYAQLEDTTSPPSPAPPAGSPSLGTRSTGSSSATSCGSTTPRRCSGDRRRVRATARRFRAVPGQRRRAGVSGPGGVLRALLDLRRRSGRRTRVCEAGAAAARRRAGRSRSGGSSTRAGQLDRDSPVPLTTSCKRCSSRTSTRATGSRGRSCLGVGAGVGARRQPHGHPEGARRPGGRRPGRAAEGPRHGRRPAKLLYDAVAAAREWRGGDLARQAVLAEVIDVRLVVAGGNLGALLHVPGDRPAVRDHRRGRSGPAGVAHPGVRPVRRLSELAAAADGGAALPLEEGGPELLAQLAARCGLQPHRSELGIEATTANEFECSTLHLRPGATRCWSAPSSTIARTCRWPSSGRWCAATTSASPDGRARGR